MAFVLGVCTVFVLSITAQQFVHLCGLAEDHNVRQQETVIWSVALWPGSGCLGATLYPGWDRGVGFRLDETRSLDRFTTKKHTHNVALTETELNFTNQTFFLSQVHQQGGLLCLHVGSNVYSTYMCVCVYVCIRRLSSTLCCACVLVTPGVESEGGAGGGEEQSSGRGAADVSDRAAPTPAVAVQERQVVHTQHPQWRWFLWCCVRSAPPH